MEIGLERKESWKVGEEKKSHRIFFYFLQILSASGEWKEGDRWQVSGDR